MTPSCVFMRLLGHCQQCLVLLVGPVPCSVRLQHNLQSVSFPSSRRNADSGAGAVGPASSRSGSAAGMLKMYSEDIHGLKV